MVSNCVDRIETLKCLASSIKRAHDSEMKEAIDLIGELVDLCEAEISNPEDFGIIKEAKIYLHGEI